MRKMAPGAEAYLAGLILMLVIGIGIGFCIGRYG